MFLFHASGLWYDEGDTIQPGNWGRVVRGWGPQPHTQLGRETDFETVRTHVAPHQPSRLKSFFGVRTEQGLHRYIAEINDPRIRHGYRVAAPAHALTFAADLGIFSRLPRAANEQEWLDLMVEYWQGAETDYVEVLVQAPVQVIAKVI